MRLRTLPGTELRVSDYCLGTMSWGEQNDAGEAHAQLDCAVAHGVNFIDTAEMYPVPPMAHTQGRTEAILGEWLARQCRDRLVIATKVAGPGRLPTGSRQRPATVVRRSPPPESRVEGLRREPGLQRHRGPVAGALCPGSRSSSSA